MTIAGSLVCSPLDVGKTPIDAYIREHLGRLTRVARALLSRATDVEPTLEEVVGALRGRDVSDGDVFGELRRACAAREARSGRGLATVTMPSADAPTTAREGAAAGAIAARQLLGRLKPTEREAVILHQIGGLSRRELAVACGVDEATVMARVGRGLLALGVSKTEEG